VIQLSGGNDGLNTVIPVEDDEYYRARPELAISRSEAIKLKSDLALHPSMSEVAGLLEDGLFSIVHGVGYPQPNRSHFESMDIWHTCRRKGQTRSAGWLGRFLDANDTLDGGDVPALHLGGEKQPLALASTSTPVPSIKSLDEFRFKGGNFLSFESQLDQFAGAQESASSASIDLLGFVQASTASAVVASQQVNEARKSYQSNVRYPESELSDKLKTVAQLIDAGLSTRIYYVELDGFDTHASQLETHAILLRQWGQAVSAITRDLNDKGHLGRVCILTFSEFGRRVSENASGGTDHGAAAPVFLAGGGLQASVYGEPPSLLDLHDGDLKYSVDFRQIYTSLLGDWLRADAAAILEGEFESLPLFSTQV
jgi:uncharacterized protein (DUF1501 family)